MSNKMLANLRDAAKNMNMPVKMTDKLEANISAHKNMNQSMAESIYLSSENPFTLFNLRVNKSLEGMIVAAQAGIKAENISQKKEHISSMDQTREEFSVNVVENKIG
jgi:hypothetical protein